VQVFTGDGKGKTTAAMGLAIRAAGAGLRVFIGQFMKPVPTSECRSLAQLPSITVRQYGLMNYIVGHANENDIRNAHAGLAEIRQFIQSGEYDVVILDEANVACYFGALTVDDVLGLIDEKPAHVELVLTGRRAHPRILERADLVTEMMPVRHYYNAGVLSRRGIEE
jgi:cob(I)alamin adenosyltransferase